MSDEKPERSRQPLVEDRLGARARVFGTEQAVLVSLDTGDRARSVEDGLAELESLANTAGIPTLTTIVQQRQKPDGATYIGKGKAEEVRAVVEEVGADVVIFNHELSPGQARNLEEQLGCKVVDRNQLIMDIFAQRAATKEAKLQVELAQLRYLLPRLRGWGKALTRLGGGIGTRGPGETQLELDREKVNRRIHSLEKRLQKASSERALRRRRREKSDLPQIVLVGYTNSGKSTLINRLADGADSMVEDKLFATLDPVVRRGEIAPARLGLFVDTVGFIRDLPHQLIPAFAATLEGARNADLILHVIDVSHPSWPDEYRSVLETLDREVFDETDIRPRMLNVLNKIDLLENGAPDELEGVAVSAKNGSHLDALRSAIGECLYPLDRNIELQVPFEAFGALEAFRGTERIQKLEYTDQGARVQMVLSEDELRELVSRGSRVIGKV